MKSFLAGLRNAKLIEARGVLTQKVTRTRKAPQKSRWGA